VKPFKDIKYVVIGTSAGGIDALKELLPMFKRPSQVSVLVVIHLPPKGPNLIPSLFESICDFTIKEAESGEKALPETIYVATPDYHLSLEPNGDLSLTNEEPVNFSRPSIDVLFDSAAHSMENKVFGILLTGANNDGANGLLEIKKLRGKTLIQDPKDADYPVMPESALKLLIPDYVCNLKGMKEILGELGE
jgi:two-component system chemotaxis response regulator CheB